MKKGFTLIELISVIIIIGVIALISVPITINITNNAKNKAYKEIIDSIELSAYNYSVYNDLGYNRLFKSLPISTIKLAGYLDNEDIIDPRNNDIIDGCVMYRYIPSTGNYEFRYTGSCTEKDFYPEIKINVLNDNNKDWLSEKIRFNIVGEYGQFKYCIGKNECNPDIYYNGETTLDTEGTNLIICATGYFDEEVGLSTCTKLYNIDYTKPTLTYTTPMKTNKITISASCSDGMSGVASTLYSLDGSSYTNKYVYTNIEYKEHNVSVKCTDVAGNVTVIDKKVTPPKITPPEITQIDWYPKSTTWAQWRIYKIKFNTGENDKNIENPYYYFKYTVKANLTEGNIVESCGAGNTPGTCSSKNTTTIEPNTWYRTNNKEIKIKVEGSKDVRGVNAGTIYAVIYDGTNFTTPSTGMINYMDKEVPSIGEINITKMYTNKVILSASCQDQTGLSGVKEILYSIDGGNYQLSNIFSNVKEGTHTVKVKCIDNALNEIEKSSNVTPPKIVNPTITQANQSPSGTWAQTRTYKITYNNTDVETPYYYFKSQVSGTVSSGVVVQSCGTGNTPSTCSNINTTTEIEPNIWYRTNNKEVLITYNTTLTTSNKYLYAVTYDGTNLSDLSGSATQTIGLMDIIVPEIKIELSGNSRNGWYIGDVTGTITNPNTVPSGISVYYYGRTNTPSTQGSTFIHKEDGVNIEYCAKVISGSGVQSSVICKTFKRDTTPPAKPSLSLDRNYDSGISNTDNITNRYSNVRFTGNAEAYSTIDIRITSRNNNIIKQVSTSSNGTYEFNIDLDQNKENVINICSVDAAGNYTCSDNLNVTVDTIAPTTPNITYIGGSNTHSWKNNYKIKLESSDLLSGIDRFLSDDNSDGNSDFDIGRTTSTTAEWTPKNGFSNCNKKFAVIDIAGNISGWTGGQHIHMDTEAPSCGEFTGGSTTWTNGNRVISVGCKDGLSDCTQSSFSQKFTSDAKTATSTITIRDNAGNTNTCSSTQNIYIDKTAPSITYVDTGWYDKNTSPWTSSDVPRTFNATDSLSGVKYYQWSSDCVNVGGTESSNYVPITWTGENVACHRAVDNAGNVGPWSSKVTIRIDKDAPTKPTVTLRLGSSTGNSYTSGSWTKEDVWHILNSKDSHSGINRYQYSHNGKDWVDDIHSLNWNSSYNNDRTEFVYRINWQGEWNFYVRAVDNVGNVSTASDLFTVRIEKNKPTISISGIPSSITQGDSYNYSSHVNRNYDNVISGENSFGCIINNASVSNTNTLSPGNYTLYCTTTSNAGNSAKASHSFSVNSSWSGCRVNLMNFSGKGGYSCECIGWESNGQASHNYGTMTKDQCLNIPDTTGGQCYYNLGSESEWRDFGSPQCE